VVACAHATPRSVILGWSDIDRHGFVSSGGSRNTAQARISRHHVERDSDGFYSVYVRDHPGTVLRVPDWVYTAGVALIIFAASIKATSYLAGIRRDLNRYVLPRAITTKQAEAIKANVQGTGFLTVKANSSDREATEYASQLFNAVRQTKWQIEFSTADTPPQPVNDGLMSHVNGMGQAPDPRNPGVEIQQLVDALNRSGVAVNGGGAQTAGEYKLYLLVGHRPLVLRPAPSSFAVAIQQWLFARLARTGG
jgi:hypothetical protein